MLGSVFFLNTPNSTDVNKRMIVWDHIVVSQRLFQTNSSAVLPACHTWATMYGRVLNTQHDAIAIDWSILPSMK